MIGDDELPWRSTEYNGVQLRVKCQNCGNYELFSCYLPSFITVLDYEIKIPCPEYGEADWIED